MFIREAEIITRYYIGHIPGRIVGISDEGVDVLSGSCDELVRIKKVGRSEDESVPARDIIKSIKTSLK